MFEVVIGGALAAITVLASWRRVRFGRRALEHSTSELSRTLGRMRDSFAVASYQRPDERHGALVRSLAATNADCAALIDLGFRVLGDIVIEGLDPNATVIVRALVGSDGTTLALLSAPSVSGARSLLGLTSHSADEMYSTRRGQLPSLAEPAFAHRQTLPVETSIADLFSRHLAFARSESAFIHVADANELIAELLRARAQIARWRNEQPQDVLLEADLQAVLGESYDQYGPLWMGRLRGRLPQATLRKKG
jgi:hypothetical protein